MITPKILLDEKEAVEILKKTKVSLWKVFLLFSGIIFGGYVYFFVLIPIKQRTDQIPAVIEQSTQNTFTNNRLEQKIDSSIRSQRQLLKNLKELKSDQVQIKQYIKVIRQEFPGFNQRLTDIDETLEILNDQEIPQSQAVIHEKKKLEFKPTIKATRQ